MQLHPVADISPAGWDTLCLPLCPLIYTLQYDFGIFTVFSKESVLCVMDVVRTWEIFTLIIWHLLAFLFLNFPWIPQNWTKLLICFLILSHLVCTWQMLKDLMNKIKYCFLLVQLGEYTEPAQTLVHTKTHHVKIPLSLFWLMSLFMFYYGLESIKYVFLKCR